MLLEKLLETRCALERGEPHRALQPLLAATPHHPPPAGSSDGGRSADEPAQQKIARSRARPPRLHGTIVPCESRRSVTYCSTWSCCSGSRSPRVATCAPRTGREREARRPTSQPGLQSSAPRRVALRSEALMQPASSSPASWSRTVSSWSDPWERAPPASSSP